MNPCLRIHRRAISPTCAKQAFAIAVQDDGAVYELAQSGRATKVSTAAGLLCERVRRNLQDDEDENDTEQTGSITAGSHCTNDGEDEDDKPDRGENAVESDSDLG